MALRMEGKLGGPVACIQGIILQQFPRSKRLNVLLHIEPLCSCLSGVVRNNRRCSEIREVLPRFPFHGIKIPGMVENTGVGKVIPFSAIVLIPSGQWATLQLIIHQHFLKPKGIQRSWKKELVVPIGNGIKGERLNPCGILSKRKKSHENEWDCDN